MQFRYILIGLVLLILLIARYWSFYKDIPKYNDGEEIRIIANVSSSPVVEGGRQSFQVLDKYGTSYKVVSSLGKEIEYGDKLLITGVFTESNFNGNSFYTIYFPSVQISQSDGNFLTQSSLWIRNKAQRLFESHLPPISASLLSGILMGGNYGMPDDFSEYLRVSGVLHIIAASGANVTFVAGAFIGIFHRLLRRQLVLIISAFGIVFYMYVAGFEPSIVRAGIMALMAFGAGLLGRQSIGVYSLIFTGYVMLVHSPPLWNDVGFQLSFAATLGILLLKPLFYNPFERREFIVLRSLSDDISITVAAQLGTLPILLSVFGNVGILSVLVNALVLWTIPILMTLAAIALIAGIFFESLGQAVLYLAIPFLWYFEAVVTLFGKMGMVWKWEEFAWQLGAGYYFLLLGIVLMMQKRKNTMKRAHLTEFNNTMKKPRKLRDEIGL